MQIYKVYKRWYEFLTVKSPDEWAITKQACRDESIVSLFFPYRNIWKKIIRKIAYELKSSHVIKFHIKISEAIFAGQLL